MKLGEFMYSTMIEPPPIPQNFLTKLTWTHEYNTRQGNTFKIPHISNNRDKQSFIYNMIVNWNNLEVTKTFSNFSSLNSFKTALRLELTNNRQSIL